ncbi:hypothetical protein JKF63_04853 [Porcisia hertigi]|uniref:DUF676 domain-containing protein n=1 Tax=Porcisia hertigi TaxID=2761500 RepID=A0A836HR89_9TRYP|nr:hypothetical protein JKF63_04853 [Porcisia hertigi]
MLRSFLEWCTSSNPTPQSAFKRAHARLACPPLSSTATADSTAAAAPHFRIVDPYHFIVCQHGVLGSAADFENLITDLFVSHEVSVLDATSVRDIRHVAKNAFRESAPSATSSISTAEHRARRAAYKAAYRLKIENPNRTNGRLYRSGNLQCFSPGSNEYLRTDAGTQVCARRMLAEVVPALHTWLNEVESKELQRRGMWAVYARTMGTTDAARLSAEASADLPVCLSLMAHSFGGILQREFIYLLLMDQTETRESDAALFDAIVTLRQRLQSLHVSFENFVTVATPHCGAGECLWWPIYFGAWCLARMNLCKTYDELILTDADRVLQHRLLDEPHLRALQLFRRRVLFANTHRDILVGFGTCSLIFENVDTDHTKFIGVAPRLAHCAAAFVSDAVEVSRPILLRSFDDMEEEEKAHSRTGYGQGCDRPHPVSTRARSYTLEDLFSFTVSLPISVGGPAVRQALCSSASEHTYSPVKVTEEGYGEDDGFRTATPRPQANSCFASGLTMSPSSFLSSQPQWPMSDSSTVARTQPSAIATSLTIRSTAPSHDEEVVRVEDVTVLWADRAVEGTYERDNTSKPSVPVSSSTAGSRHLQSFFLLCRRGTSTLYSVPQSLFTPDSTGTDATTSDLSDLNLVTSSHRSRKTSTISSLLLDPRLASEHVRCVASTLHAAAKRRLSMPTTGAFAGQTSEFDVTAVRAAMPASNAVTLVEGAPSFQAPSTDPSTMPRMSDREAHAPHYRQAPRAIAATLRQKMSWRVRAIRLGNILPAGHVACLGNWAFFGRSPSVVEAIAEELLTIL